MLRSKIKQIGRFVIRPILSIRTASQMWWDLERLVPRLRVYLRYWGTKNLEPQYEKLHLGCGARKVDGWLNVDLADSDFDLDLSTGYLPWKNNAFLFVVSQHVVEHLILASELIPLLKEVRRTLKPGGELWLSTPDIEKICQAYLDNQLQHLIADRKSRYPDWDLDDIPSVHMLNELFHQKGKHKNLFDFTLLEWTLKQGGFEHINRVRENDLLERFPEFLPRHDEAQSLYVRAIASTEQTEK